MTGNLTHQKCQGEIQIVLKTAVVVKHGWGHDNIVDLRLKIEEL